MASVALHRISKAYERGQPVVETLSLAIPDGQFLVLVGPSGCGKSTTLRMIAGLEAPSSGQVMIGERDVTNVSPRDRDVAMVFQNYALYPHMTVRNNMSFALKLAGMPRDKIDERVGRVAGMLGIEPLLDRRPGQLSGGQRQRVAVGRAIVREPKVFLFDEPLSNLDAKLRVATRAELKLLHQQLRTTTVYVTHDQEEAMTLGDRLVVMHRGQVMQDDSPHAVFERPANRFVAGFIGTPPMNFIDGRFVTSSAAVEFAGVSGSSDALRWALPARIGQQVSHALNQPVTLGVRPTALHEGAASDGSLSLRGTIALVELLGEHSDVTVQAPWGRLVARVPTRSGLTTGTPITLSADASRVHFFASGETGANLVHLPPQRAEQRPSSVGATA
jgi:multiple sugar transport system ATP-binding protein